jgi:hypothetical protein
MAVNFGTYEGHRILTDGMNRTLDRAARRHEFEENKRMEHAKARMEKERQIEAARQFNESQAESARQFNERFAENQRQFNVQDQYNAQDAAQKQFAFDEMKKNIAREEQGREVAKTLLGDIRPDSYSIIDPETGMLRDRETVSKILSDPLDKSYIQDVLDRAPDISIEEAEKIASNTSRRHAQRLMDSMIGEFSRKGWNKDQIAEHLEAANLTGEMDNYMRRAMGINPDSEAFTADNPILRALYGSEYDPSAIGSASDYGITSTRHDNKAKSKSQEKALMKAMEKFGKYSKGQSSWMFDDADDISFSQNADGDWTLREQDALFDDEYKIEFDDKGPYVTAGLFQGPGGKGSKIYLNNSEQFEDLEDLLE